MNGKKRPPKKTKKQTLSDLSAYKWDDSKYKARFSEGKGKFSGYVVDKADNSKRFKKSDPELKKRKAAYKKKYIASQKSKATKAAATLKKDTGLTPRQYYKTLEERRSKMAKKRKK
jgi:hypothetical protein